MAPTKNVSNPEYDPSNFLIVTTVGLALVPLIWFFKATRTTSKVNAKEDCESKVSRSEHGTGRIRRNQQGKNTSKPQSQTVIVQVATTVQEGKSINDLVHSYNPLKPLRPTYLFKFFWTFTTCQLSAVWLVC